MLAIVFLEQNNSIRLVISKQAKKHSQNKELFFILIQKYLFFEEFLMFCAYTA